MNLDKIISEKEAFLNELKGIKANIEAEKNAIKQQELAYQNATNALFDGIKIIADPEHPLSLTFPQFVKANLFYKTEDGTRYICVKDGIVTTENINEYLENDDLYAPEEESEEIEESFEAPEGDTIEE